MNDIYTYQVNHASTLLQAAEKSKARHDQHGHTEQYHQYRRCEQASRLRAFYEERKAVVAGIDGQTQDDHQPSYYLE